MRLRRRIRLVGDPVLLTLAEPVADPAAPEVQDLIDDMVVTLAEAQGLGLAAPQVGHSLRLVLALPVADPAGRAAGLPSILLNPELEPLDGGQEHGFEGCLSIPGLRGRVARHRRVRYRALDRHGRPVAGEAEGLFARVLQHEVDHLDGVLYPMRMADLRHLAVLGELPHLSAWIASQGEPA